MDARLLSLSRSGACLCVFAALRAQVPPCSSAAMRAQSAREGGSARHVRVGCTGGRSGARVRLQMCAQRSDAFCSPV
eukprot:847308-Lingulodinium_polyedra.AAC.1